jgi:hypothetical protein
MKLLNLKDLPVERELDEKAMAAVHGGRQKLPGQHAQIGGLLTDAVGDPVDVYVDGVKVNSVTTGYAPR